MATRSSKLLLRRVEAHARAPRGPPGNRREKISILQTRPRRADAEGFLAKKMVVASTRSPRDAHVSAASSRRLGEEALRDLFARNSEPTEFKTKARNPRDVRDAVTAMAGAFAAAGDSDGVRALMERAGAVGVEPDQHVFNALLRSDGPVASASGRTRDEDAAEDHEDPFFDERARRENDASFSYDDPEHATLDDGTAVPKPPVVAHFDARARETHRAVVRVETMMRDMIESGVERRPALVHGAPLGVRARRRRCRRRGRARGDARARHPGGHARVQRAAAGVRGGRRPGRRGQDQGRDDPRRGAQRRRAGRGDVPAPLPRVRARSRQVAAVLRDRDDWDDWDDVLGGQGFGGRAHESHARLAGALVERRSDGAYNDVGEAARAAIRSAKNAAREGLSSVTDVFARGVGGLASSEAEGFEKNKSGSPELRARARRSWRSAMTWRARACGTRGGARRRRWRRWGVSASSTR